MKCLKVDLRKINLNETATWNVWKQFGVDIKNMNQPLNVRVHYMPQEEQDRLQNYMLDNYKKLKAYTPRTKKYIKEAIPYEILAYFPTAVLNE